MGLSESHLALGFFAVFCILYWLKFLIVINFDLFFSTDYFNVNGLFQFSTFQILSISLPESVPVADRFSMFTARGRCQETDFTEVKIFDFLKILGFDR